MEFKDYYRVLDVPRTATADEIRKSYRRLARRFHPDVSKEPRAEERFKEVQEAYEVLKDPAKRAAYDQLGADYRPGQQFRPPPDFRGRSDFHGEPDEEQGLSEFFSSLFGGGSPFAGASGRRGGGAGPGRGGDSHAGLEVTLEEAYQGAQKTIEFSRPEFADGELAVATRTLRVTIPPGVTQGQLIRLQGQGGAGGKEAGDLYLEVHFAPHPWFVVEGRDVTLTLPVAPWEAALGATVSVPTLGGPVEMRIPAGRGGGGRPRRTAR